MIAQVVERAGLTFWPIASMLIFLVSVAAMTLWLFRRGSGGFYRELGAMALAPEELERGGSGPGPGRG